MGRKTLSHQVQLLQQQHRKLQHTVVCLEREGRRLTLRHALAEKWVEGLDLIDQQLSSTAQQEVHVADSVQQVLDEASSTEPWPSLEQLLQPDPNTISPATDPLALLRCLLSPAIQLQPEDVTAEGHACLMKHTATTLAIKLQQLQALPPDQQELKLQEIAAIWHRYWHVQSGLILMARHDVIERACTLNFETMQPEPEAAAKHHELQAPAMMQALGLTEQQEEVIAVTFRLHCDIVAVIHAELQAQMSQLEAGQGSSSSSASSSSSSGSRSGVSAAAGGLERLQDRREQLQQQQFLADKLNSLLRREYWVRVVANLFLYGSLTLVQVSKLSVLSWPFGLRLFCVGVAIMQQREAQDQQLLQRAR